MPRKKDVTLIPDIAPAPAHTIEPATRVTHSDLLPDDAAARAYIGAVGLGPELPGGVVTEAPGTRWMPLRVATPGGLESACRSEAPRVGGLEVIGHEVSDLRSDLLRELHRWLVCSFRGACIQTGTEKYFNFHLRLNVIA